MYFLYALMLAVGMICSRGEVPEELAVTSLTLITVPGEVECVSPLQCGRHLLVLQRDILCLLCVLTA